MRGYRQLNLSLVLLGFLIGVFACTTSEIAPLKPPEPPAYTKVIHPEGTDLKDLAAIFMSSTAPRDPGFINECDSEFKKLKSKTDSIAEIEEGVRELIAQDPVYYHWCFYGKLQELESYIKSSAFLDEKQKAVLTTYEFLVLLARRFETEYHDTRYMRWATTRYQHLSEWIFYRKLELTPAGTLVLVQPSNPFGLYRKPEILTSILNKYDIAKPATPPENNRKPESLPESPPESKPVKESKPEKSPIPAEDVPIVTAEPPIQP